MYFRNNGAVFTEQCIEQRTFTRIGGSDDRDRQPVFNGISRLETLGKFQSMTAYLPGKRYKFRAVGELDILFGKIKFQFHKGNQMQQIIAHLLQLR